MTFVVWLSQRLRQTTRRLKPQSERVWHFSSIEDVRGSRRKQARARRERTHMKVEEGKTGKGGERGRENRGKNRENREDRKAPIWQARQVEKGASEERARRRQ
eukprot:6183303-Pleurochrysis_carterae.AAC.1